MGESSTCYSSGVSSFDIIAPNNRLTHATTCKDSTAGNLSFLCDSMGVGGSKVGLRRLFSLVESYNISAQKNNPRICDAFKKNLSHGWVWIFKFFTDQQKRGAVSSLGTAGTERVVRSQSILAADPRPLLACKAHFHEIRSKLGAQWNVQSCNFKISTTKGQFHNTNSSSSRIEYLNSTYLNNRLRLSQIFILCIKLTLILQ